ncbi:MAG: hypothetical protein ACTSR2_14935 [Candidatus Hodarchaeales archaeon]
MLIFSVQAIFSGVLFGLLVGGGLFIISDEIVLSVRKDNPDEEFINSQAFVMLLKYFAPIGIVLGAGLIVGPIFAGIRSQFLLKETIFGSEPALAYIVTIFILAMTLNVAVLITKTPYPLFKLISNTWMFITLGLILDLIS